MKFFYAALALAFLGIVGCAEPPAQEPEPTPTTAQATGAEEPGDGGAVSTAAAGTFASVSGIFDRSCISCHGDTGADGVDLRSYESIMRGGEHGAIVVAGNPDESILIHSLRGQHGAKQMPLNQPPLSEEEIASVEEWIRAGAPDA
jgi:mono/diheme cytochrome c family protein